MKRFAVLMAMVSLLFAGPALAAGLPLNFAGTAWQGDVTYVTESGTPASLNVVLTFATQNGPNNVFLTGTIEASDPASAPLPDGFPSTFTAIAGPFATSLLHMTGPDSIMFADVFRKGKLRRLGIRGSITGGALNGSTFMGMLIMQ